MAVPVMAWVAAAPSRGVEVPAWLAEAASVQTAGDTAKAVVLLHEQTVRVSPSGRMLTRERRVLRILRGDGRNEAIARLYYDSGSQRIRDLKAWVLPAGAGAFEVPSNREVDLAQVDFSAYSELRVRVLPAHEDVAPGSVFGCEWTLESRQIFTQFRWALQGQLPCRLSRFTLELPRGWTAQGTMAHHAPAAPRVEGSRFVWELRDLPGLAVEPACPPATSLAARLDVGCAPPAGEAGDLMRFSTWSEVAHWLDAIAGPMRLPSPDVAARAREAVRGARTELDTIRSVGRAVQRLRYASIPLGLQGGGGYRPVPAATTLARGYGDCKDKANLMRSLLESLGIEARLVAVYSGDPDYVEEAWPSPFPFNHCIVAVRSRGTTSLASTIHDPALGALTLFDPTDPFTPLGDLPPGIQGSLALVFAPETRGPLRVPRIMGHEAMERRVTMGLDARGDVIGRLEWRASGSMAAPLRQLLHHGGVAERRAAFERRFSGTAGGVRIGTIDAADDTLEDRLRTRVDFELTGFGQGRRDLWVFRPFLFPAADPSLLALAEPRQHPIVLPASALRETVVVYLPAGFRLDEWPEPITLDATFGRYASSRRQSGRMVEVTRRLDVQPGRLPPDSLPAVLAFERAIQKFEQSPVVLVRE